MFRSVELARWYADLLPDDRVRVEHVVRQAVHAAVFGFLATLDGVQKWDDAGGRLELNYVAPDGSRSLLNDFNEELLHDIYQGRVFDDTFGAPESGRRS